VFALANGLAGGGLLSPADTRWWRGANDRANASYIEPTSVSPDCYDPTSNPGARAWFKHDANDLLAMTCEYLDLLDRYHVGWVELKTASPGRIVYEDAVQVVAVPPTFEGDWPFQVDRGLSAQLRDTP